MPKLTDDEFQEFLDAKGIVMKIAVVREDGDDGRDSRCALSGALGSARLRHRKHEALDKVDHALLHVTVALSAQACLRARVRRPPLPRIRLAGCQGERRIAHGFALSGPPTHCDFFDALDDFNCHSCLTRRRQCN